MDIDMENDILYLILTLEENEQRMKNVNELIQKHPYFEKFRAYHWKNDWLELNNFLNENGFEISSNYNPIRGKIALWATMLKALLYANNTEFKYVVIIQDDIKIDDDFKDKLYKHYIKNDYVKNNGSRLGNYGHGYVFDINYINKILNAVKKHGIDKANDHFLIGVKRKHNKNPPKLVKKSNKKIVFPVKGVSNNSSIKDSKN